MSNIPNFNKHNVCVKQLKTEKIARSEGIYAEDYFIDEFLINQQKISRENISTDWWFSRIFSSQPRAIKIFYTGDRLNKADMVLIDRLRQKKFTIQMYAYSKTGMFVRANNIENVVLCFK